MGRLSRVARAVISVVFSVLTILFFYSYLAPYGLSPTRLFGSDFSNFFGTAITGNSGTTYVPSAYASLLPGGAAGLIIFTVLSRMGGVARSSMAPRMSPSSDEMMKMMNMPQMMGGMGRMPGMMAVPENLPGDITKSQFVVLRCFRQGMGNRDAIARTLSMDRNDVDFASSALMTNGYLSKNSKLTSKGMDLLGS